MSNLEVTASEQGGILQWFSTNITFVRFCACANVHSKYKFDFVLSFTDENNFQYWKSFIGNGLLDRKRTISFNVACVCHVSQHLYIVHHHCPIVQVVCFDGDLKMYTSYFTAGFYVLSWDQTAVQNPIFLTHFSILCGIAMSDNSHVLSGWPCLAETRRTFPPLNPDYLWCTSLQMSTTFPGSGVPAAAHVLSHCRRSSI